VADDPRLDPTPATANEELLDQAILRGIQLERLKEGLVRDIVAFLNDDVLPDVIGRMGRLERIASRGTGSGVWKTQRYADLIDSIKSAIDSGVAQARAEYLAKLYGLSSAEAGWAVSQIKAQVAQFGFDVTAPSGTLLRAIVSSEPFEGQTASEWFGTLGDNTLLRVGRAIDAGLAQGETIDEMVRRVRGTADLGYADGVFQTTRREAEALVRTGAAHVSARAREQTYAENSDLVDGVQWVATLDHRTCPRCGALDGQSFPPGKGPRPPVHVNCRCTAVPNLKSWKQLGISLAEAPPGTRASLNGEVPDAITFGDWLRGQPASVQEDVLGVRASALFRSGARTIDQFSNDRGRILTLDELGAR
jgi:SPP1 gp7 family putative phage head morphogenesis protein